MRVDEKRLSIEMLDSSHEIYEWLDQFQPSDVLIAKSLLSQLIFISRDVYSKWLLESLAVFASDSCAIYAIRKFDDSEECLWDINGDTLPRPAHALGSEDLVVSVISNANRQYSNCFLDHPSLNVMREKRVRKIILIDDSIGSGKRAFDFITIMKKNKTFMSWWSYGLLTIHIISYARTTESEQTIMKALPGSGCIKRKSVVAEKIEFISKIVYEINDINKRWGSNSDRIYMLCKHFIRVKPRWRLGFGDVMSNIIFYHSVPNNIPGLLFITNLRWNPLFPNRSLPAWVIKLLESNNPPDYNYETPGYKININSDIAILLQLVRSGVRTRKSISRRMNYDVKIVNDLIKKCIFAGFITAQIRITKLGVDIIRTQDVKMVIEPNYSLYVPKTWRVDQDFIQPSVHETDNVQAQTDSIDGNL